MSASAATNVGRRRLFGAAGAARLQSQDKNPSRGLSVRIHEAPHAAPDVAARQSAATPAPERFELRSTVRYRAGGRTHIGTVVAITHVDPLRYDIRPLMGSRSSRKAGPHLSFAIPHGDILALVAPPPEGQKVIVLDDPLRDTAGALSETPASKRPTKRFLAALLGMASAP